jgi:hypothetical protein
VFVPFLHQAMKHLGRYVEARPWYTVGEIFDLSEAPIVGAGGRDSGLPPSPNGLPAGYGVAGGARDTRSGTTRDESAIVLTPAGNPVDITGSSRRTFELSEPGFYEVRTANHKAGEGTFMAVNVSAVESDLTSFDPGEFVTAVSAPGAAGATGAARELTAEDHERRQSLWWYLLAGGLLLLAIEAIVASRYPRIAQG